MADTETRKTDSPLWPPALNGTKPVQSMEVLRDAFIELLVAEGLPVENGLLPLFDTLYLPMASWLADQQQTTPLLVGINGAQGSGKSTLTLILEKLLQTGYNRRVVSLSIDDLYLGRQQRLTLAEEVHPLFATRGVPGTHDIPLAMQLLGTLKSGGNSQLQIPVFDKANDDRAAESLWKTVQGPVDIIIFEGWCVASAAQHKEQLQTPINTLEKNEDADAFWRGYVNQKLEHEYAELFAMIDCLLMLKVPDMKNVFEWRLLQEQKLRDSVKQDARKAQHIMSEDELRRFIMHYERITRNNLEEMPDRADLLLCLNDKHQVEQVRAKIELSESSTL